MEQAEDRETLVFGPAGIPATAEVAPGGVADGAGAEVVDGREPHAYGVLALQQITGPMMPGRYFITAEGLAGPGGGPALGNLRAMAVQATGGGSNTSQSRITGASGFSDGNTGAVFLPNGGIVSYGN